jgi:nicotinate-nucleotide--dimethylbenzimidazole phosphoribosyltransferase
VSLVFPPAPSIRPVERPRRRGRLDDLLRWYESCQTGGELAEPVNTRLLLGEAGPEWPSSAAPDDVREVRWATDTSGTSAFDFGRGVVDREADCGAELLLLADSPRAWTSATAAIAAIVDMEPVTAVGWGQCGEERHWVEEVSAVRDERYRLFGAARAPERLIELVGQEIAVTAGFCLQAALRRTPLLLDGEVSTAGALIADQLLPGARGWWQAAHRTGGPAHEKGLARLGLAPTFALELAVDGLGPILALQALRTAIRAAA